MSEASTVNPAREYERLARARRDLAAGSISDEQRALARVLTRPEFQPFLAGLDVKIGELEVPFRVRPDGSIEVARSALSAPAALAFYVRYALEQIAWEHASRSVATHEASWIAAVMALHTALVYVSTMPKNERALAIDAFPGAFKDAYNGLIGLQYAGGRDEERVAFLGAYVPFVVEIGVNTTDLAAVNIDNAIRTAARGLMLAQPVEQLLTSGGDERLYLSPETGLNKYGCSPRPRPWAATFSTCTASSISSIGYRAAELQRRSLFAAVLEDRLRSEFSLQMESVRSELLTALKVDSVQGTEVVLTASGTDAELVAVYCATRGDNSSIVNIVVAPHEVGSGTVHAASGRHFDPHPPLGADVTPGDPIEGFSCGRIQVRPLDIRDDGGNVRALQEVDRELIAVVEDSVQAGCFVIIHLLDCSKTGFGGPSFELLCQLKNTYQDRLAIIVDAAQMRVSRRMLVSYLRHGFLVIATGSKFFTGPPFSGALFVPPEFASSERKPQLPKGLRDYCAQSDFPATWRNLTENLSTSMNFGLMMRWRAALWEMIAFFAVPASERRELFAEFASRIHAYMSVRPEIVPLQTDLYQRSYEHQNDDWDKVPTIFSFFVRRIAMAAEGTQYLTYDEAKKVYHWLNSDISMLLPADSEPAERELARLCCHIGQPVSVKSDVGEWCGALRIAVGARLISRVLFDPELGVDKDERLTRQVSSASRVFEKIGVICRHWGEINERLASMKEDRFPPPTPGFCSQSDPVISI